LDNLTKNWPCKVRTVNLRKKLLMAFRMCRRKVYANSMKVYSFQQHIWNWAGHYQPVSFFTLALLRLQLLAFKKPT